MSNFAYHDMFPIGADETPYRKITSDYVDVQSLGGQDILTIDPKGIAELTSTAMRDIAHLLRPGHLQQLADILEDDEASDNDHFVARELLKNANVAAGMVLPSCQDTGTAIVIGKKG